jgi:hypothetical protein
MSAILDIRSDPLTIRFSKGKTIRHSFYLFSTTDNKTYTAPNLTGCTARMSAKENYSDVSSLTGFPLTTENGGLTIVTSTELDPRGVSHNNVYGIQIYIPATTTAAFTWDRAFYDLELIYPNTDVVEFLRGVLEVSPEVTT